MKANVAFALAAACLGASIAFIEMGVRAVVAEKADEAWEKVAEPTVAKAE